MTHSEQLDQFAAALAAFQAEMPSIPKSHTAKIPTKAGGEYSYSYADLADTVERAAPLLGPHGLSVSQDPEFDGTHDLLTTMVLHSSGQWKKASMRLLLTAGDPKSHGSAITYARRYAYCAALGIVADEDDDGTAASKASQRRPVVRKPPDGVVDAKTAKTALLHAYGGDKQAAAEAWGDRGSQPISEQELADLLEGRPL